MVIMSDLGWIYLSTNVSDYQQQRVMLAFIHVDLRMQIVPDGPGRARGTAESKRRNREKAGGVRANEHRMVLDGTLHDLATTATEQHES